MDFANLMTMIREFKSPNVFNPWNDSDPMDCWDAAANNRILRLLNHFNCIPQFILIGEAPGYQGCHFSGIPFTNEALLLEGLIPRAPILCRITSRPIPWREPSATIVWNQLYKLGIAQSTILWNAFAWHPHKPGQPYTNRAPTKQELLAGAPVLEAVLQYFHQARRIAVGRVAEAALRRLGVKDFDTVRHPSMGGANKFRVQLAEIVAGG